MPTLFSYGSNNMDQLAARLGHTVDGTAAFVEGWQRVFRGHSTRWGGGVATLVKKDAGVTYGYVASVSSYDLDILDEYEGVASGRYRRKNMKVRVGPSFTAAPRQAVVYVSSSRAFGAPTAAYLKAVAKTVGEFWDNVNPGSFPIR
jgi:hypothetical protein